ncbi:MAG: monovalent cation/H+ antiporter subunit D family protein [Candidatus Eutrophobiaceae bacterium]
MIENLPVLHAVLPIVFAALNIVVRRNRLVWVLSGLCAAYCSASAILIVFHVLEHGDLVHELGGWPPPWGIEMRVDLLGAYVLAIVNFLAAAIIIFGDALVRREIAADRRYLYYAAFLLNIAGFNGIIVTGDAFNLFVFIEIASLSSYALIAVGPHRHCLLASYHYLIYGTIGASFILISVGLLYALTGTLNMRELQAALPALRGSSSLGVAMAFFIMGIMLKCAMFPLHLWLPKAYTWSPSAVGAFLAGTSAKVFLYVLLRFFGGIFDLQYAFGQLHLDVVFMCLAVAGMFYGTVLAIRQSCLRTLLAWSSIAQISYMALGISLGTVAGLAAALIHMFNHALIKTALFVFAAMASMRLGVGMQDCQIKDLRGLARKFPGLAAAFVIAGMALVGVPLTAGFVSKWFLISAIIEQRNWVLVFLVALSSVLSVIYVWRVVETMYADAEPELGANAWRGRGFALGWLLWLLIAGSVFFGVYASWNVNLATEAIVRLVDGQGR